MSLKICRICYNSEGVSPIFNDDNANGPPLYAKIMYCCAKVSIMEGDGLPSYICRGCDEELAAAYHFVLKCEATDEKLRSLAANSLLVKDCRPKTEDKSEDRIVLPVGHGSGYMGKDPIYVFSEDLSTSDHERFNQNFDHDYTPLEPEQEQKPKPGNEVKKKKPYKERGKYKEKDPNVDPCMCGVCGRKFAHSSYVYIHMRNHTGETPYPCPKCDKKFKDHGSLNRHLDIHHHEGERERKFMCQQCGKGYYTQHDAKIHMRSHTGETPYECTDCPLKFALIGSLVRHRKKHTGEKPHACSACPKRFSTKWSLIEHSHAHSSKRNYSCPTCKASFKYNSTLQKHLHTHIYPNNFICNHCSRAFNLKDGLVSHIKRQHSEKAGHCDVCSKNVPNIEVHMWRHTGERPLKCKLCTKSYFEQNQLARHINYIHKYPDKYKCTHEACAMSFPSVQMLEFHVAKFHENRILFPCDRCSRGFFRKNDLARHKIGTHKERLAK